MFRNQPPKKPNRGNHNASPSHDPDSTLASSNLAKSDGTHPIPPKTPFEQILAMLDDSAKLQLLRAMQAYHVDPDDGFSVILLSHATVAQSLLDAPAKIKAGVDQIFRQHLAAIDRYLSRVQEVTVKQTEASIAQSVARINQVYTQRQEMSGRAALAIPMLSIASVALVGFGAAGGWVFNQAQQSPIVPGKVSLTQRQVDDLRWLATSEAQLAKNLVKWNEGQIAACQKNQVALLDEGQVVVAGYGKVKSGACVLWVVPSDIRRFEVQ
ncbi:hypothetical protein IQ266_21970 [filamentous cyanobacterium LEGE 11480]|uniref:Uncharacterized protein n=1 Tax=Romeriopsis navalis LEGE 11480 TaxID=2777977 RepID=A0A928VTQ7_9CYAN|nr:DUF6753 family protein [Romeriopsis navalis]MBE9032410.1 hypothetical protein [Romeriopsis navalis LEGE 11480]